MYVIAPAKPADLAEIVRLLQEARLPTSDVAQHAASFFVAKSGDTLAGVAGLERAGPAGLLRSLAVAPEFRGHGLGKALCARVTAYAAEQGIREIYLLTSTADQFFAKLGFRVVPREAAPEAVRATREFASLCPVSAVLMAKDTQARRR
jgi:amino-acid N-acetyltransferase